MNTAPARDDPSVGLLRSLTADALDPDYEVAARRGDAASRVQTHGRRTTIAAILLLLVGVLLVGGVVGLRTSRTGSNVQRQQLRARVVDQVRLTDVKAARVLVLRQEVAKLLGQGSPSGSVGSTLLDEVAGATAVSGPGVRIALQDATRAVGGDPTNQQLARVLDVDVQNAVNGLWAAGADAVAVNGQRVTSLTAIRSAGDAILVNYRPLSPPYVVEGIGDPQTMQARLSGTASWQALQAAASGYGLRVDTSTQDRLVLPAATLTLRTARTPNHQEAIP